ncbi:hypothetical protein [Glycomyces sp. NRRL B-16210]|uniref:hypothetical protein n=1 Tax=Glycomyces sp. NRRL B-16210 TaxID=1463821 RepID=UPI0004C12416|nr:hypothetical protein [Glycomyces sp. NRRL B-16210]
MSVRVWWDISDAELSSAEELDEFIREHNAMIAPQGVRAWSLLIGPSGSAIEDMPLRLDFDADPGSPPVTTEAEASARLKADPEVTGTAAARWLPSGLKAAEAGREPKALRVCESSDEELADLPAELGRLSFAAARALARAYLETGERPEAEGVTWDLVEG